MNRLGAMLQVGRTFGIRDGMLRLEYELQRSSGLMSWRMRSVQGWDSWDLQRIAPGVRADEIKSIRRDGTCPFFFADARTLGSSVRNILEAAGEAAVLAGAEGILAGNLPFFGQLSFNCRFPPRWFENPVTAQTVSPQQPWTQMRFASPLYGDLKFILEPSRFLFVYPLVRAYALNGDERFAQAFWSAVEDWAHHSPPMAGPLWICGQECSLRILAWSFGLHGFIHSPSSTSGRIKLLVSMIAAHAWRTAQTLGYARSQRSNHLIAEAVGLWTAGTLFPELREAQVWQSLGAQLLHDAVIDQITPEGVSQQHSFNYQRMILHLLLWTLRLAEIHSAPLHEDIRKRTQAAFDFLRPWIDPVSGLAPNYGSDDGSLILPLALGEHHDYRPLLQLGAAVLDRPALNPGPWDEAVLWFGAKSFGTKLGAKAAIAEKTVTAPPSVETGYFRLGDDNSWAMIRAGRYTRRPFQADQLHVDLWWQGVNLSRDAGTYLYNGPPPWNNGLAGTAVHNTVTVDHRDQMRRAGRFLWVDWAQASGRSYCSPNSARANRFDGEHDGYRRSGIKHRRMVRWLPDTGWVIADDLEGTGTHELRLHWLTADLPYEVSESPFQVTFKSGQSRVFWNIFSSSPGRGAIVRAGAPAGENSPAVNTELLGWESPTYGDLRPVVSMLYDTRSRLPVRFLTVVLTSERCRVELIDDELVVLKNEAEIYRVSVSTKEMLGAKTQSSPASHPKS
jgi:Heparinase II/III-like protein/Heparinase II/III N-terminus